MINFLLGCATMIAVAILFPDLHKKILSTVQKYTGREVT